MPPQTFEPLIFKSADHPDITGVPGECYAVLFPLADGRELVIEFGEDRHAVLRDVLGLSPKGKRRSLKKTS